MFLDFIDVLRSPGQRLEKPLKIAATHIGDIELAAPIEGKIHIEHARRNLVVGGKAKASIVVPCSRCLKPSVQELDLELEAVAPIELFNAEGFLPSSERDDEFDIPEEYFEDEDEESLPDDELVALFEGHTLDVSELVRQAIELQAPLAPLCSPDCKGLPGTEKYFEAPADDRWDALREWSRDKKDENPTNGSRAEQNE